jgi:hypothetical protein
VVHELGEAKVYTFNCGEWIVKGTKAKPQLSELALSLIESVDEEGVRTVLETLQQHDTGYEVSKHAHVLSAADHPRRLRCTPGTNQVPEQMRTVLHE